VSGLLVPPLGRRSEDDEDVPLTSDPNPDPRTGESRPGPMATVRMALTDGAVQSPIVFFRDPFRLESPSTRSWGWHERGRSAPKAADAGSLARFGTGRKKSHVTC
jgi:hypothetical protein